MEELIDKMMDRVPAIVKGLPLTYNDIKEERKEGVMMMAFHCILNGPVGVNKPTHFPGIQGVEEVKIKDFVDVSNNSWKLFCKEVALVIKHKNPQIDCNTRLRFGDYWPLAAIPEKKQQ